MKIAVQFFKDRFKFSAAHFTIFSDGEVERLHGHNYVVEVTLEGDRLKDGMVFPFHQVKPEIDTLCAAWDEYVLLPGQAPWVTIERAGDQTRLQLVTPEVRKHYSFPTEDVVVLPCDNISSENLALLFHQALAARLSDIGVEVTGLSVGVSESSGQKVTVSG